MVNSYVSKPVKIQQQTLPKHKKLTVCDLTKGQLYIVNCIKFLKVNIKFLIAFFNSFIKRDNRPPRKIPRETIKRDKVLNS